MFETKMWERRPVSKSQANEVSWVLIQVSKQLGDTQLNQKCSGEHSLYKEFLTELGMIMTW